MIQILPVEGIGEVHPGDDIASLITASASLHGGDIVVVTQKIVSKAEGRVVQIDPLRAEQERLSWVERETVRVVARRADLIIAETRHGFVCANAGVDASNVEAGHLSLLPLDPDGSAHAIRRGLMEQTGADVGVIISDTFGRAWRRGQTNVAIGVSGIAPLRDHVGSKDAYGNELHATLIAIADEIAGAAELVMGKADQIPVAIVRGVPAAGDGSGRDLVRDASEDLFRTGG